MPDVTQLLKWQSPNFVYFALIVLYSLYITVFDFLLNLFFLSCVFSLTALLTPPERRCYNSVLSSFQSHSYYMLLGE